MGTYGDRVFFGVFCTCVGYVSVAIESDVSCPDLWNNMIMIMHTRKPDWDCECIGFRHS